MTKRRWKSAASKAAALLLALALSFSMATPALAADGPQAAAGFNQVMPEAGEPAGGAPEAEDPQEDPPPDDSLPPEGEDPVDPGDDLPPEDGQDPEDGTEPGQDQPEPGSEPPAEDSQPPEDTAAPPPPDETETSGMVLTAAMVEGKAQLAALEMADRLEAMAADEDFVEHEVVYATTSAAEARQVAEAYGGIVTSFSEDVAVIKLAQDVAEAVAVAEDLDNDFPPVYPNFIYSIDSEPADEPGENDSGASGGASAPAEDSTPAEEAPAEPDSTPDDSAPPVDDDPAPGARAEDIVTLFEQEWLTQADVDAMAVPEEPPEQYAALTDDELSPDAAAPNDPYAGLQWHHNKVGTYSAWTVTKGKGVTVAVIDSGINGSHPDLKANIAGKYNTHRAAYNGGEDNDGHGTHVAGIIAARANNKIGVAGVAPEAKLISIKALERNRSTGKTSGSTSDIARAVNVAVKKGAKIINMSLGGGSYDSTFQRAITNAASKGVVVVVAAGNSTLNLNSSAYYPARYSNVICVSATTSSDTKASFSNYGSSYITVGAPGTSIYSTYLKKSYRSLQGTSMACPVVAGVAALVMSTNSIYKHKSIETTNQIRQAITSHTTKGVYADTHYFGAGLVNAARSVGLVSKPALSQASKALLTATNAAGTVSVGVSSDSGARFYYTTNGKTPNFTSSSTTGSVTINTQGKSAVTLKVVASVNGRLSKVTTATYSVKTMLYSVSLAAKSGIGSVGIGKKLTLKPTLAPAKPTNKKLTWSSDNPAVAKVAGGVVTGVAAGSTTIRVRAQDGSGKTAAFAVTVRPATQSLKLNASKLNLSTQAYTLKGVTYPTSYKLGVTPSPAGALSGDTSFTYTSSNKKVVTVSAAGSISVVGPGSAKVTAAARDGSGKKVTCTVKVVRPARIASITNKQGQPAQVSGGAFQVARGKSIDLTAVLQDKSATNKKVVWSSVNPAIAKVSATGRVTGVQNGSVSFTVKTADGVNPALTFTVHVRDASAGLTVNNPKIALTMRGSTIGSQQLSVTNKTATAYTGLYKYTSSNKKVATVSATGRVTAVGKGSATITVKCVDGSGRSATAKVTVKKLVSSIYSSVPSYTVAVGKTVTIKATASPSDASNKKLTWAVTNPAAFSISSKGVLKAKVKGQTTQVIITAADGSGTSVTRGTFYSR